MSTARQVENQMALEAYATMIDALPEHDLSRVSAASRVIGTVDCDPAIKQAYALELRMRSALIAQHEGRMTQFPISDLMS